MAGAHGGAAAGRVPPDDGYLITLPFEPSHYYDGGVDTFGFGSEFDPVYATQYAALTNALVSDYRQLTLSPMANSSSGYMDVDTDVVTAPRWVDIGMIGKMKINPLYGFDSQSQESDLPVYAPLGDYATLSGYASLDGVQETSFYDDIRLFQVPVATTHELGVVNEHYGLPPASATKAFCNDQYVVVSSLAGRVPPLKSTADKLATREKVGAEVASRCFCCVFTLSLLDWLTQRTQPWYKKRINKIILSLLFLLLLGAAIAVVSSSM
jgi:hypothetical protein